MKTGFVYSDCWVEDSRLVVLTARDAAQRGAEIHNYTEFKQAVKDGDAWRVTMQSVDGESQTLRARTIVNAAGPGLEKVARLIDGAAGQVKPLRLVKGSHIVVSKLYDGEHAYILQNTDRRMIFVIPFEQDYSLIGTTDLHQDAEDQTPPHITDSEIDYLLQAVNGYFAKPVTREMIKYTYSGIRPLFDDGDANNSQVTRDYKLVLSGAATPNVLSVYGGKITTFRRLAEEAVDQIAQSRGAGQTARKPWTHDATLPGGDLPALSNKRDPKTKATPDAQTPTARMKSFVASLQSRYPFLSPQLTERLAFTYGTGALTLLGDSKRMDDLGQNFGGETLGALTAREVDYLVEHEWAREADDILFRRTRLGMVQGLIDREKLQDYMQSK